MQYATAMYANHGEWVTDMANNQGLYGCFMSGKTALPAQTLTMDPSDLAAGSSKSYETKASVSTIRAVYGQTIAHNGDLPVPETV